MPQYICPLSMASEQIKQCTTSCKFYDTEKSECKLVIATDAISAVKSQCR